MSRAEAVTLANRYRRQGKRIVFTNGVFDILHRGHLDILEFAKRAGDVLFVGMNSDASTRRLKGPKRPINSQRDRARLLGGLKPVDHVVIFGTDTPLSLIKAIRPDVLVKGAEYATDAIVGAEEVRSWGGTVRRFKMRKGYSTTKLATSLKRTK